MAAVYLSWKYEKVHTPLDSPQSSLFPVFSAFCAKRGLDPATHSLFTQPKGRTPGARVDMSVNWGMLGLNTNCVLEVLQCGAEAGAAAGPASGGGGGGEVRIALDGESGRYITSVPSGTTLRDVVLAGIASGTLKGVVAARAPHLRGVSLVYLRSAIPSLATTLAAIGLRGGSAAFKLVCSAVEPPPEEGHSEGQGEAPGMDCAAPAVEAAVPQQQPQDLPSPAPQLPLQPETRPVISFLPAAALSAASAASATASASAAASAAAAAAPAQQQPFINFMSSSSSSTYSAAASAAAAAPALPPAPLPAVGAGQDARVRAATARARAGLAGLLANNYDSTSAQVLARLLRLLDNLLLQPSNPSVRSLRRGNAAFEAAVGAHEGALEVLRAVGFEDASESSGASFLRLERSECPACTRAVRRAVAEEARALGVPIDAEPPAEGRAAGAGAGAGAGDAGAAMQAAPGPLLGAGEAAALAEQLARDREARLARAAERAAADALSSAAAAAEEAAVRARAAAAMAAWAEASESRAAAGGSSSSSNISSTVLSRVGGSGSSGSGSEGSPLQTKTERRVAELRSRARDIMRSAQPVARGTQVSVFDPQQAGSAAASASASQGGGAGGGRGMEEEEDDPEARRIQLEYYAAKLKREAEEAERVRLSFFLSCAGGACVGLSYLRCSCFWRCAFALAFFFPAALAQMHSTPPLFPPRAQGLRTRAMAELEALEKSSVFVTTVIRVQFPDRLVVQACFSPLETLSSVYEWVRGLLAPQQGGSQQAGAAGAVVSGAMVAVAAAGSNTNDDSVPVSVSV